MPTDSEQAGSSGVASPCSVYIVLEREVNVKDDPYLGRLPRLTSRPLSESGDGGYARLAREIIGALHRTRRP